MVVGEAELAQIGEILVPRHGLTAGRVSLLRLAPIAEFLALIDERLARGGQHHGRRLFLLVSILSERFRGTVLVVVGHEYGCDGIATLCLMVVDIPGHSADIRVCAASDSHGQCTEILEFEVGDQPLIVLLFNIVFFPGLSHHEYVIGMAGILICLVHCLVPLVQEALVGLDLGLVHPQYGVKAEAVHAEIHPLRGGLYGSLEGLGLFAGSIRAIVEIGHRITETSHVISR